MKTSKASLTSKTSKSESSEKDTLALPWNAVDVLSEELAFERWAVNNTVQLLDNDNTIPFIARYRKEQTNNMEADQIRKLKDKYDDLK